MDLDLASIIGLILGVGLVLLGMFLQGQMIIYVSASSALIVIGGTLGGVVLAYSFKHLKDAFAALKIAFSSQEYEASEIISILVSFAEKARREGLLALEEESNQIDDEFLKKGIQLVVDGTDPELVKSILKTELDFMEERHGINSGVFSTAAELAPAFGMIGTLIGLIGMLSQLENPSQLGGGMAVALITTFYGSVLANVFFVPIAEKLAVKSEEEILVKEVMIEGILSIQAGENPRIVEEKLKAFLAPTTRTDIEEEEAVNVNAAG
ncbi:flagellar motor component [Halobacteroides halobius DSM 5150]|uniref:Flagellar motor component n=1 Tax=Halobacteroides halobius (strain ATCC 35273 / DSM 5150 / MD-1) TaxID=748449 RepID=L0K6I0_HALHC|nr:motility protein A [Halobacteroides halobius]AGB40636.1 flagellar motor component [Halobacteroides halobius DSM 5150]